MDSQWLGPAFLVFFILIVGWSIRTALNRQRGLRRTASLLGMRYEKRLDSLGKDGLSRLPMFSKGDIRARNVLTGDVGGATCYLFDYVYVSRKRSGKRSTYAQGTYSCFRLRDFRLPVFRIVPASRGSKKERILFEDYPVFSRDYIVTGEDEPAVRKALDGKLLEYLQPRGQEAWVVEADGEWLGIAKRPAVSAKRHLKPDDMRQFREDVVHIFTLLSPG